MDPAKTLEQMMTPLEAAILNMLELAALEDTPPFARLLHRRGSVPTGANPDGALALVPPARPKIKALGED